MAWCLPPEFVDKFLGGLKDGSIDPIKLADMSSEDRRAELAKYVGDEHAAEVNGKLENAMLRQNQQQAFVTWAKQTAGLTEPAKRDLIARVGRMDRLLNPDEEKSFLSDAAAQKIGASVTVDEARQISELAKTATALRDDMAGGWTADKGRAYGRAQAQFDDYINSLKPDSATYLEKFANLANLPKTALTTAVHLSAPLVQGWGMISRARWSEAFANQLKYYADEANFQNLRADMIGNPDVQLLRKSGLSLTDIDGPINAREEAMQSNLILQANTWLSEKTGGAIPNAVRASNRAFYGFLNYTRSQSALDYLTAARLRGEDVSAGSRALSDIAKVVNDFTGRGNIGIADRSRAVAPLLNAAFFAPRKISATVNMFNPERYLNPNISPTARIQAIRNLLGSVAVTATTAGLLAASGIATVDWNPESANFMKFQAGDEKFDMTGGNAIFMRLLARIATGKMITASGKVEDVGVGNVPNRGMLMAQFLRGKLSPLAGMFTDWFLGKDPVGRPFSMSQELQDKFAPITIQAFQHFAWSDPKNYAAIALMPFTVFGASVESPIQRDFGLPDGPVNDELNRLRFNENDMERATGNGKFDDLTKAEMAPLVQNTLTGIVQSPGYKSLSDAQKGLMLDSVLKSLRRAAVAQAAAKDPDDFIKIRQNRSMNARLQAVLGAPQQ